jgi:hypothetical protein
MKTTVHEILATDIELCSACNKPVDLTQDCWVHFRVNHTKTVGAVGFVSSYVVAAMHVECGDAAVAVRP